jgi:hypothetical protein
MTMRFRTIRRNSIPVAFAALTAMTATLRSQELYPSQPISLTDRLALSLPASPAQILEYDRAIYVLNFGLSHKWTNRTQYLHAVRAFNAQGTSGESLATIRSAMVSYLNGRLREHQVWDEGVPIEVEVRRVIDQLSKEREEMLAAEMGKDASAP